MDASIYMKSKYLKASDFEVGTTNKLRIGDVTEEQVGEDREKKLCLHFAGMDQTLLLNQTQNGRMIELFGRNTDGWINMTVQVSVASTLFKGKQVNTFLIDPVTKAQANGNPFAGKQPVMQSTVFGAMREYTDAEAPAEEAEPA